MAARIATVGLAPSVAFPVLSGPFREEPSLRLSTWPCFAGRQERPHRSMAGLPRWPTTSDPRARRPSALDGQLARVKGSDKPVSVLQASGGSTARA